MEAEDVFNMMIGINMVNSPFKVIQACATRCNG